jgi:hypothetical protein
MDDADQKTKLRIRAAIQDRATWLALLYRSFSEVLSEDEVQRLCRRAIYEFGRLKAARDPEGFGPQAWVQRHVDKGSAQVFDSEIERHPDGAVQKMQHCPLVEAWRAMGCSRREIELLCDIAMEGDRGRADAHNLRMELDETIARGDPCCRLVLSAVSHEAETE